MAVLHDYECEAHGHFESKTGKCPSGCSKSFVKMVFLQPVGVKGARTKFVDAELRAQARQYGMTNLHTQRSGESAMEAQRRTQPIPEASRVITVDVPHNKPGWSQRDEKPATFDLGTVGTFKGRGLDPENGPFKQILKPPTPGVIYGRGKEP